MFYLGERAAKNESGAVLQGKFKLIEPIAWGGMAAVYKARNLETKGLCAVKVLYSGAREQVASLFGQEGRLATRIRSPHLIRANAFGEDAGRPFIVFDYVQGEVLAGLYFMKLMPWRELLRLILQVLDALATLHRRGIVHRDVKPDNVIVEKKLGDEVHVTLLDLGCASVPPERRLTGAPVPAREVYGTAGFIAPELLAGCLPEPRNDLYSVGAMMYLKLTAQAVPDIGADPERLVIPSARAFVPSIPAGVDDVVMRALSDVEARFQTAEEMAAVIREVIAAEDHAAIREVIAAEDRAAGLALSASPQAAEPPAASPAETSVPPATPGAAAPAFSAAPEPPSLPPTSSVAAPVVMGANDPVPHGRVVAERPGRGRGRGMAAGLVLGVVVGLGAGHALRGPVGAGEADEFEHSEREAGPTPGRGGLPTTPASPPDVPGIAPTVHAAVTASSPPKVPRRSPSLSRSRLVVSFEKVMGELEGKARECADAAGLPAEPLEVQVLGEDSKISTVRVVHLGTRHPFTRCIDPAIRAAAPPLGDEPIRGYTFFTRRR